MSEKKEQKTSYEDFLIEEINKCELMISKLEDSEIYKILAKDMKYKLKESDHSWHLLTAEKLENARISKLLAIRFFDIKKGYVEELSSLQSQLTNYKMLDKEEKGTWESWYQDQVAQCEGNENLSKTIINDWDNG